MENVELPINGCRYCGELERDHARVWTEGVGWHTYVEPGDVVRRSRLIIQGRLPDDSGSARMSRIVEEEGLPY